MKVVLASPGDEKLSVPGFAFARSIGVDDQIERRRADTGDAGKVFHRIERQILVHERRDCVPVRGQHEGVAIGCSLRDAHRPREPGAVLDDDLLVPALGQFVGEDARHDVGHTAGAERDDNGNPLVRIILGDRRCGSAESCGKQCRHPNPKHANHGHHIPPNIVGAPIQWVAAS